MKKILLATALLASIFTSPNTLYAQERSVLGVPLTPGTVYAAMSPQYTAASNTAALQAAINGVCNGQVSAFATIRMPAGNLPFSPSGVTIPCLQLDIGGAGRGATYLTVVTGGGAATPFTYVQALNNPWSGRGELHDFSLVATDNPSSGAGVFLDHANYVELYNVLIQGFFTDVDCNYCINNSLGPPIALGGVETVAGSSMLKLRRTVTTVATASDMPNATTALTLASAAGIYNNMTVTGSANIPASATVICNATVNCTLSAATTGDVPISTSLTFSDSNPSSNFLSDFLLQAATPFETNYTYGIWVQDTDGFWIGKGHTSWVTNSDLFVQPGHSTDIIDNILSDPGSYFDRAGSSTVGGTSVDFEPYGAVYGTTNGTTASTNTTLNLSVAPSVDVTGYAILVNGVTAGTTCSSGCTTATPTMSAGANTLGIASGANVTFYPAYTGRNDDHVIAGYAQGSYSNAVLFSDPALVTVRAPLSILNTQKNAIDIRAGAYFNFNGSTVSNSNIANAGYVDALIEGNASHVNLTGATLIAGSSPVPYHISKQGQATYVIMSGDDFEGSGTADIIDQSLSSTHTDVGECTTTQTASPPASAMGCPKILVAGNGSSASNTYLESAAGNINFEVQGFETGVASYLTVQSTGGANGPTIYGVGTSAGTLNILAKSSGAGTIKIGTGNSDAVSLGGNVTLNGTLTAASLGTVTPGTNGAACVSTSGVIGANTANCIVSLTALKRDIETLTLRQATDDLFGIEPATFVMRNDPKQEKQLGFIADNVHDVAPQCSTYDDSGKLLGYRPECLLAVIFRVVQEDHHRHGPFRHHE